MYSRVREIIMEFSQSVNMDSAMIEMSSSIDMVEGYFEDKGGIERKARRQQALLAGGRCGLSTCVGLGGGIPEPQAWAPRESLTRQVTLSMVAHTLV